MKLRYIALIFTLLATVYMVEAGSGSSRQRNNNNAENQEENKIFETIDKNGKISNDKTRRTLKPTLSITQTGESGNQFDLTMLNQNPKPKKDRPANQRFRDVDYRDFDELPNDYENTGSAVNDKDNYNNATSFIEEEEDIYNNI